MWQPPAERRMNRCSAKKEFSRLFNMLPVEVQMPVQVNIHTHEGRASEGFMQM